MTGNADHIDAPRRPRVAEPHRSARRKSLLALAVVALVSLAVLIWAWSGADAEDALFQEAAKTAMQALAVSGLGGIAGLAVFTFQDSRTSEARQRSEQQEHWRRKLEKLRDARDRQDELLRSLLDQTLGTYNRVKDTRRHLVAETNDSSRGHVEVESYDSRMAELIRDQLEFEKFKRLAPFIPDDRLRTGTSEAESTLSSCYKKIESYLNKVVDEYKTERYRVGASGRGLEQLPRLAAFMHAGGTRGFVRNVADQIDEIISMLQAAVLSPLDLPTPPTKPSPVAGERAP